MVGEIDLELGGENTLYMDVVGLPSTVKIGLTVKAYNHDDVGLYFKVTGSDAAWAFNEKTLGLIGSGASFQTNLADFMERAKPTAELTEVVTVTLNAYTDAGYTDLKHTLDVSLTVKWIKSDDGSWTEDVLNDFDDGTVQGWASSDPCSGISPAEGVATDYVLSAPYSLRAGVDIGGHVPVCPRFYKSFVTPDKNIVYAIVNVRATSEVAGFALKYFEVSRDGTILVHVGKPHDTTSATYIPKNQWMRMVVPLPKNVTVQMRIILDGYNSTVSIYWYRMWMDDFKIISKD